VKKSTVFYLANMKKMNYWSLINNSIYIIYIYAWYKYIHTHVRMHAHTVYISSFVLQKESQKYI
jgi:hypothetical protein